MARAHQANNNWLEDEETRWRRWRGRASLLPGIRLVPASAAPPLCRRRAGGEAVRSHRRCAGDDDQRCGPPRGRLGDAVRVTGEAADLVLGLILLVSPSEFDQVEAVVPMVTAFAIGAPLILLCAFLDRSPE